MRHFLPGRSLYVLESMWGSSQWRRFCLISKEARARPWLICILSNVYQQTIFPIIKIRLWDLPCITSVWINLSFSFSSRKRLCWQEYCRPLDMSNMSISHLMNHQPCPEVNADGESWSRWRQGNFWWRTSMMNYGMHASSIIILLSFPSRMHSPGDMFPYVRHMPLNSASRPRLPSAYRIITIWTTHSQYIHYKKLVNPWRFLADGFTNRHWQT